MQRNVLVIKSADIETNFLPESELPSFARLHSYDSAEEEMLEETIKASAHSSNRMKNLFNLKRIMLNIYVNLKNQERLKQNHQNHTQKM